VSSTGVGELATSVHAYVRCRGGQVHLQRPADCRTPDQRPLSMPVLLPILLLPFVEIAVLILVGNAIGFWPTFGLVVAGSLAGLWVLRSHAASAQMMLERGRSQASPAVLLAQGALTVAAGLALILPGLVTSVLGITLLLPPVQRLLIERLRRRLRARGAQVYEAEIIEGTYSVETPPQPDPGTSTPPPRIDPPHNH